MDWPCQTHMQAALRVLKYLKKASRQSLYSLKAYNECDRQGAQTQGEQWLVTVFLLESHLSARSLRGSIRSQHVILICHRHQRSWLKNKLASYKNKHVLFSLLISS
ncbi:Uncharacterized protein TCM_002906 [Theobroma cacao]|uniref:Uncharacterized protein n=1 Tax=Theobroma cacao TaxID=3641 RepID=A0A061DN96_THECC|nr:Uncharacterized protein TCM_002906 [Theobroma cacao]